MTKARSAAPSARPGDLDNVDGGLERRGYSQTVQIAQGFGRKAALLPEADDPASTGGKTREGNDAAIRGLCAGTLTLMTTPIIESQPALVKRIADEQEKWKKALIK